MTMIFNIGELHPNTPYLFADLAELALWVRYNGKTRLHKNDLEGVLARGVISPDEIDSEENAEAMEDEAEMPSAQKLERREQQLEDVMFQLNYRTGALNDLYPFEVEGETLELKANLTPKQRVYGFLLACSRLRSFQRPTPQTPNDIAKGVAQRWAKAFTELCKIALTGLLPTNATVRIFDANSHDRATYYTHVLSEALKTLGKDLGVIHVNEVECNKAGASGDAGLDLVAVVDFADGAATNYAILGQCGAQETGWPAKTLEAHIFRFSTYFQRMFDYPGIMFTPVCYRAGDGQWFDNQAATGVMLLDRGRILSLIETQKRWDEIVETNWFQAYEADIATTVAPD